MSHSIQVYITVVITYNALLRKTRERERERERGV
jgi:hypothetical protein